VGPRLPQPDPRHPPRLLRPLARGEQALPHRRHRARRDHHAARTGCGSTSSSTASSRTSRTGVSGSSMSRPARASSTRTSCFSTPSSRATSGARSGWGYTPLRRSHVRRDSDYVRPHAAEGTWRTPGASSMRIEHQAATMSPTFANGQAARSRSARLHASFLAKRFKDRSNDRWYRRTRLTKDKPDHHADDARARDDSTRDPARTLRQTSSRAHPTSPAPGAATTLEPCIVQPYNGGNIEPLVSMNYESPTKRDTDQ
jgi:hypothetical protein